MLSEVFPYNAIDNFFFYLLDRGIFFWPNIVILPVKESEIIIKREIRFIVINMISKRDFFAESESRLRRKMRISIDSKKFK